MASKESLLYTKEHEWLAIDGDVATVGITSYAAEKLGDVVYVDLPAVDPFGAGWLVKIRFAALPTLLSHAEYAQLTDEG